eukprot:gene9098-10042_t
MTFTRAKFTHRNKRLGHRVHATISSPTFPSSDDAPAIVSPSPSRFFQQQSSSPRESSMSSEVVTSPTDWHTSHIITSMDNSSSSEVRRIVDRVDQAFKTRKEECRRLLWEISDLENQLECLQKNTRDYSEASAAQGAALSWSQANIEKIEDRWKGIEESSLKPMLREYHLLVNLTDEMKGYQHYFADRHRNFQNSWEELLSEAIQQFERQESSEMHMEDGLSKLKEVDHALVASGERAQALSEGLGQTKQSIADVKQAISQDEECFQMVNEDCFSMLLLIEETELENKHFETQVEELEKQTVIDKQSAEAAIASTAAETTAEHQKISALQWKVEQLIAITQLQEQRLQQEHQQQSTLDIELAQVHEQLIQREKHCSELRLEYEGLRTANENNQHELESKRLAREHSRSQVEKAEQENEAHYLLACNKLKELRELQQRDTVLRLELQHWKKEYEDQACQLEAKVNQAAAESNIWLERKIDTQNKFNEEKNMLDLIKEQVLLLDEDTLSHILEISNRDNEMKQLHAEKEMLLITEEQLMEKVCERP